MNLSTWFIFLIVGCMACSKPSTAPDLPGPYTVTALLNDSTWFGSAYAVKRKYIAGQSACPSNQVDINFSTDLPYDTNASKNTITGCSGNCAPTQVLGFRAIPLAVGRYTISELHSCTGQDGSAVYYAQLSGDIIIDTYDGQRSKVGWIEVTNYNTTQHVVEGAFEVELVNQTLKPARFQKGLFKALIK